ncbi:MAG: efflux RND transporter periplasmic adaptor subunit [Flavobacteriaceae bacterium]
MKKIITSIAFLSLIGFVTSCSKSEEKTATELPAISVTINQTAGSNSGKYVTASGKIEAENSANISTRMMGYVTSIKVKTGQKVSKGQLLATISGTDLQAKKAQAEAGVNQATAFYNSAKRDYDRFVVLFSQKSASQKEMDDMTTHFEMAKASLETAKQMKNEVMAQFSYTNITAPFSGTVTGTFVKEGDMANPGMPIVSVEGTSKLQAVVMVSESEITHIKNGITTDVTIKSLDKTIKGKVTEVSTSARNTGGQYIVKIDLDKTENVLSGMFVNVVFPIEKQAEKTQNNLVLIPQEAVITQGQLRGIYVVNDDNTAILRWLRLGKTYGNDIEVLSGLASGEKYVLKADGRLFNGVKVNIQ